MVIPPSEDMDFLGEIFFKCDGILISGGSDIDPKHYGEDNLPGNGNISPLRDFSELFLAKMAMEKNKPILGICRGAQIINVALGGTLYQDIYGQIKDITLIKHVQEAPKWYPTHEITITKGSKVWKSLKTESVRVNSYHHQAVKDLAPGMKATSKTSDGIIESIELDGHKYAVGIQWHPEVMWERHSLFLNIFSDFVAMAR